jgi:hypothetical protein
MIAFSGSAVLSWRVDTLNHALAVNITSRCIDL